MRARTPVSFALVALMYGLLGSPLGCGSADDSPFSTRGDDDSGAGDGGGTGGGGGSQAGGTTGAGGGSSSNGGSGGTNGSGGNANDGSPGTGGAATDGGGSGGAATDGGASGGSTGTDGGDGGACLDEDQDGQTTCAGDCDDQDPNNFSGNQEYCGDGQDNDCDNQADENCGGIGTYVSNTGDDNNPGTQALPVATIQKGMQNAQTIGGNTPVFIGQGHYSEKVQLVEGISLLGGYQCDQTTCSWARDPSTYDSAILNQDAEGVLATDSITRATVVDGLRLQGSNGGGTGRGRAAITLRGGSPTLTNDVINGPTVSSGSYPAGRSIGILIESPTNSTQGPLIQNCTIQGGQTTDNSIGIVMDSGGNTGSTYAEIRGNTIRGGAGASSTGMVAGSSGAGTLVQDNDISAGTSSATNGGAWGINVGGKLTIDDNRINVGGSGTCASGNAGYCGGIISQSSTSTITNNVVFGIDAPFSVGVLLNEAEVPGGAVILNGNYIDGGGTASSTRTAAVVLRIGTCNTCGFNGKIGRIRNDILVGGLGAARFGVYEDAPAGKTQHPEALENDDFFVAGGTLGGSDALYRYYDGTTQTLMTTLSAVNGLATQIPALVVGANLAADPLVDATYHLTSASPCANAGTSTEAPATDMDGEARPKGTAIDVGADEAK